MLYLVTALYEEALPFLTKYNLKRKTDFPHFELFTGENVMLLITRPGPLRAAAALSSMLTAFPPARNDILLSVGCAGCALENMLGKAFLICRITEEASGRTRYPELLYRCPFPEAEVVTQARVRLEPSPGAQSPNKKDSGNAALSDIRAVSGIGNGRKNLQFNPTDSAASLPLLYDMEAAGIYEAAIPYFSCERLFFLKVVSDALTGLSELPEAKRRALVTDCITAILPELSAWLDKLSGYAASIYESSPLGPDGAILFTQICTALRLSTASSRRLYQLMLYLALSGSAYVDSMREFLAAPLAVPCRTKKEGLKYLERLSESYL